MSALSGVSADRATQDADAVAALMRSAGPRLRERMARIERHLERVTGEAGVPLATHAAATVSAGGKRLRPLLVVLAREAAGGAASDGQPLSDGPPLSDGQPLSDGLPLSDGRPAADGLPAATGEDELALVRAATAVELVHSATLVHDDVIDGAELRRGHPTVVADAGRRMAIATGDLLFSCAFAELARNNDVTQLRALSDASSALAVGELLQREDAYTARVAVERYLRRCELKTAALFEAACRLGALVAGRDAQAATTAALADGLGAFARRIGLAFQLLDDVLDVSGPVERTGKARGTDLLDGTVTLPLILARERDTELAEVDLAALDGPKQADELCERIAATGALDEARRRALALVAEAKRELARFLPVDRAVLLELVADAVVERYR
ncbi:MAG TPA: polyprenyl synthetase family protein [Solirubrobacteraceae bacterium]|nr:polyprenyl synthetase family protein [Solirubrobacteraceae bacterium]